ncbi:MAG: PhoH family protein, partial [Gemmatimonadaceae bacterium]
MSEETTIQRLNTEGADLLTLAGVNDENLVELARQTGAKIALRGEALAISGNSDAVSRAVPIAQRMIDTAKQQLPLTADDVLRMSIEGPRDGNGNGTDNDSRIVLPGVRKIIQAKTAGQAEYMKLMADNDIVVGIGPAGTGKTYLAVAAAVDALSRKRVRRIVL